MSAPGADMAGATYIINMPKPAPSLVEVVDLVLREKLPLKIDWNNLHTRAVAAAIAEHIMLWSGVEPRPRCRTAKPDPDVVAAINFVLRHKLPGMVHWNDEPESDVVAYAVAEHVQQVFELRRGSPTQRSEAGA